MTQLADLSARELLDAFRGRSLSPVEVMRAVIARIEASEPHLGATYLFRPDQALAGAAESEARWQRGEARALEGVPLTIKDNVATAGDPMPLGTAARRSGSAMQHDAPAAARMREAGAVMVTKTTMPDYGMLSSGLSSFHTLARNPWDTTKTPGGSSSGAGSAAAAGYGPLHIGTDIGGSVRLPGTWSGIVALKPSFGRIPVDPPYWGRVVGPMTRTVGDAALMMRELSRPDARDGMSLPPAELDYEASVAPKGLRIGYLPDVGIGLPVDPEVAAVVAKAARLFEAEGAVVETIPPFLTRAMLDGLDQFWRQRSFADLATLGEEERAQVLPYIRDWVEPARGYDGMTVYRGVSQLHALRDATLAATRAYDFVISPVAPGTAFPADWGSPLNDPARPFEHIVFTVPFNFSEQPAISVPAGMSSGGMPIGLQIVGRRFDDAGVMGLAAAFERLRDPLPAWPTLHERRA